jgi:hypothetical protein
MSGYIAWKSWRYKRLELVGKPELGSYPVYTADLIAGIIRIAAPSSDGYFLVCKSG